MKETIKALPHEWMSSIMMKSKRIIPKAIAAAAGSADPHTAAAAASLNDLIPVMLDFWRSRCLPSERPLQKRNDENRGTGQHDDKRLILGKPHGTDKIPYMIGI